MIITTMQTNRCIMYRFYLTGCRRPGLLKSGVGPFVVGLTTMALPDGWVMKMLARCRPGIYCQQAAFTPLPSVARRMRLQARCLVSLLFRGIQGTPAEKLLPSWQKTIHWKIFTYKAPCSMENPGLTVSLRIPISLMGAYYNCKWVNGLMKIGVKVNSKMK